MSAPAYTDLYLWINGQKLSGGGRPESAVINPFDGSTLGQMPHATAQDLQAALGSADQGFKTWRAVPAWERAAVIERAVAWLRERSEQLATLLTLEVGKPLAEARMELGLTFESMIWCAEEAKRIYGRTLEPRIPHGRAVVTREPVGPVAAFAPWNVPALLTGRKIAAALAAGCSMVIKPSEETPATCLLIAEAFAAAGLPAGVLNVVLGDPDFISRTLLASRIIRKVSFTGPEPVGRQLAKLAADNITPITMELGGHAPVIVCDDADIDAAVAASVPNKFFNAGASCIAPTRFYVQDSVFDRFVAAFVQGAQSLKMGSGFDPETRMGPLANARRLAAMERLIADAVARGSKLETGGARVKGDGFFWAPTVLTNVPEDADIMNHEPFGPVATISRFSTLDEAIEKANRLPFGLGAYAFTRSLQRAHQLADRIESGMVGINTYYFGMPEGPFGGVKQSGYGSENGTEGIDAYLVTKFVHMV
ncbi:NAD-dependent succinate-semialdehyde dehydrogenase [Rubrivivax gelatinosus]|uniref:Succinate-semialdehyde dehydrogenase/glutarate-semialdehyde dehydrogenase n=1 Tax=Rubrivivax gelatinosus TaxID=28068 RepID=A0A4R2MBG5_RUBGE|nr:NAD-dependent succinate-semialdehyde dehydrogenase [Rubrivivax gelatinosus]MBK1685914.1 NAD-dependent succinate-semialdehyde dehydrogenase [Rubrivivax gelatinosus]TCP04062.1 succinate-semialdehyde dehydrogenase/glutarate-semialdehyde dehydrogenase [Rubrivivax gelatinosus]